MVENDEDDEESEWEDGEDDIEFERNAFDFIIDDEVNKKSVLYCFLCL